MDTHDLDIFIWCVPFDYQTALPDGSHKLLFTFQADLLEHSSSALHSQGEIYSLLQMINPSLSTLALAR